MKKVLALILTVLMLLSTVAIVASAEETDAAQPVEINLEDWYGATYVGAALGVDDAKPVQDGVISLGEYQAEYRIARGDMENIPTDTSRWGYQALLLSDYNQFISHDEEWIYVGFAFTTGTENTRGRLYWNLCFIDSFDVIYYGGTSVKDAFKQGDYALNDGWFFGAEIAENADEDGTYKFSTRAGENGHVDRGTAPVKGTDYTVVANKITHIWTGGTNRQVYEFKVSKAWYAAQVGLESAADVRELAWVVLGGDINTGASSYTQIGHYITDEDLEMLANSGLTYTRPSGSPFKSDVEIYDDASLPLLFVLDVDPNAEGEQARVPTEQAEPAWACSHIWDDGVVTIAPTHLETGERIRTCLDCGETITLVVDPLPDHTWNDGVVTLEPTHLTTGTKIYTCACGATKTEDIEKLTAHTYGDWQQYSYSQHAKYCECGNREYADHTWNNGVVTTEPTHMETGVKTYTCTDCGATYTEALDKLTEHEYGSWGKHNADQHIRFCPCGGGIDYADHSWNNGAVTLAPTQLTTGIKTYTCTDCGETKTEVLAKLTGGDVETCDHTWNDGAITVAATHTSTGIKTYTCSGCGTTTTEVIAKTAEHTYGEWSQHNAANHSKTCACGDVVYAEHEWNDGVVTVEATHLANGIKIYTCTDCGETAIAVIDKLAAPAETTAEETEVLPTTNSTVTNSALTNAVTTNVATAADAAMSASITDNGCSGSILGGGAAMISIASMLGVAVARKRKKED